MDKEKILKSKLSETELKRVVTKIVAENIPNNILESTRLLIKSIITEHENNLSEKDRGDGCCYDQHRIIDHCHLSIDLPSRLDVYQFLCKYDKITDQKHPEYTLRKSLCSRLISLRERYQYFRGTFCFGLEKIPLSELNLPSLNPCFSLENFTEKPPLLYYYVATNGENTIYFCISLTEINNITNKILSNIIDYLEELILKYPILRLPHDVTKLNVEESIKLAGMSDDFEDAILTLNDHYSYVKSSTTLDSRDLRLSYLLDYVPLNIKERLRKINNYERYNRTW